MVDRLQKGMQGGVFKPRDPSLAAATLLGMLNMMHILFHIGKLADPDLRDRMLKEVLSAAMLYLKEL